MRSSQPRSRASARSCATSASWFLALVTFVFALQLVVPVRPRQGQDRRARCPTSTTSRSATSSAARCPAASTSRRSRSARGRPRPTRVATHAASSRSSRSTSACCALLRGTASVDVDAKIGTGHLKRQHRRCRQGQDLTLDIEGTNLPAASLPMREALGLPMTGKIDVRRQLDLPNEKSKTGQGRSRTGQGRRRRSASSRARRGCTFGDGKTKLKPHAQERAQRRRSSARASTSARSTSTRCSRRSTIKDGQLDAHQVRGEVSRTASSTSTTR